MSTRSSNAAPPAPGGLVDIVSGSFGAGHDAAASAIADRLQARGFHTRTWDVVDLMPDRLGRVVRSGYLRQVQSAPATWRWLLHAVERHERVAVGIGSALQTTEGGLLEIAADGPEAIISTHPFASQALGHLRSTGRLRAPVTTYLTDMSVHRLWVHPGVDEHLAVHDLPAREALALGARSVTVVAPAVGTAFGRVANDPWTRAQARRALALPRRERLALVTGGSCGIGRLFESARDVAATGVATPVVLCGTNARLLGRVRKRPDMVGLGWVQDMPALVSAVDVVIQNAGGITSLETAAAGVPMVTYRCIAGHGETNAAALEAAGIAPWVRDPDGLGVALLRALHATPVGVGARRHLPDVVDTLFPTPALIA